jgi:hypothetical protein
MIAHQVLPQLDVLFIIVDKGYRISTADINPIGAISKTDLRKFIAYAKDAFELPVLERCVYAYANRFEC